MSAGVAAAVTVALVPAAASAYHYSSGNVASGGAPLDIILPFAGVVAVGMIAFAVWGRARRKSKPKGGKAKRRPKAPARKRR